MFVKAAFKPSVRTYLLPKDVEGVQEGDDQEEDDNIQL